MLNPMVLKFFYPIKLTRVMGRIHQSKHDWQLSRRFEIKSDHSSIRFTGIKHQEMPYNLCQSV